MKIFSAQQIRDWDAYTIANEPITSHGLMERAAGKCFTWLTANLKDATSYLIFCGTGNNGGDGIAVARMLCEAKLSVQVFIVDGEKRSADFTINLEKLKALNVTPQFIATKKDFPIINADSILIDALFGTGLSKPLSGLSADLVDYINQSTATTISIDMPSGLFVDQPSENNAIIHAKHTLSFQLNKLAFLMPENEQYIGDVHLLDIGLHRNYYAETEANFSITDESLVQSVYKPRDKFSHKYDFGNTLLLTGSKDMMGAAILCAKACLRSGAGLVTVHCEEATQGVIQAAFPEAITTTEDDFNKMVEKKNAIGIGPGLKAHTRNRELLQQAIALDTLPLVIDATALQLLIQFTANLKQRKQNPAILTPHTGEFEKLFGSTANGFERIGLAMQKAKELNCYIVLKGHNTLIACPDGKGFFNPTGNAGMATAGSGDVLTGMLAGLLAQGYPQKDACILAVYLHGLAGDIAAVEFSQEAMIAGDIIDNIGEGFKKIQGITLKKSTL